jgi:hypothetical protein
MRCNIGSANAAVFPVPVSALSEQVTASREAAGSSPAELEWALVTEGGYDVGELAAKSEVVKLAVRVWCGHPAR